MRSAQPFYCAALLQTLPTPSFIECTFLLKAPYVRREVCAKVHFLVFTVAILAQGTNRGDALCAALLLRRVASSLGWAFFSQRS